jgi:hypothetical protein
VTFPAASNLVVSQRIPVSEKRRLPGEVRRHFKQLRKGKDCGIDVTYLRQNSSAINFGEWFDEGVVLIIGHALPRLLERIRLTIDSSIGKSQEKPRSEKWWTAENTARS